MSHALVRALRARGVDVVTALEEGMIERDDEREKWLLTPFSHFSSSELRDLRVPSTSLRTCLRGEYQSTLKQE